MLKTLSLPRTLAILSLLLSSSEGERIKSPAMGFIVKRTAAEADTVFGLPLQRTPTWVGTIAGVSGNSITLPSAMEEGVLVASPHYLLVTSGQLRGYSFAIQAHESETVIVDPNADNDLEQQGMRAGDACKLIPYWTLGSLFKDGTGIGQSTDPYAPVSLVRTYDPSAVGADHLPTRSYFYYGGEHKSLSKGWYDLSDFQAGRQDDVLLSSETHLIIRNGPDTHAVLVMAGCVPVSEIGTSVGRFETDVIQDNLVINPYPVEVTLGTSGLIESGAVEGSPDPYNPRDLVRILSAPDGYDPLPKISYFYYNGDAIEKGWYNLSDFAAGVQNDLSIPAGAAFIIRKGRGNPGTAMWLPTPPYSN